MTELGDLIKRARQRKRWTQEDLANKVGHKASYISRIEKGEPRGSEEILFNIAKALEISPQMVFDTAGIKVRFVPGKRESLNGRTYEFATLSPEIKEFLLEIVPIVEKYMKS